MICRSDEWQHLLRDPNVDDRASLFLTYGRGGTVLDWGVYSGIDKLGLDCPTKANKRFPRNKPFVVIGGVSIYLVVGIHGGSVWRCIPPGALGNAKPLEVAVWYSSDSGVKLKSPAITQIGLCLSVIRGRFVRPSVVALPSFFHL